MAWYCSPGLCMLFPFVHSFVVRLAFVFHCFFVYCLHYTSGMRDSVVQLGESLLSWSFSPFLKQSCHVRNNHSAQNKKGDTLELKEPHWRFTLNHLCLNYHIPFVMGEGRGGENQFWCIPGLNVALFFISVFMSADFDWPWSCSLLPAFFPAFVFVSRPPYICLLLCLPIMTLLFSQMLFPCII